MSFNVYPEGSRAPVVAVENAEPEEPVFVATYDDGVIQVVDLVMVREWADAMYHDNAELPHKELYIRLPGSPSLLTCAITFAGGGSSPLMVTIVGVGSTSGVLWTAEV